MPAASHQDSRKRGEETIAGARIERRMREEVIVGSLLFAPRELLGATLMLALVSIIKKARL